MAIFRVKHSGSTNGRAVALTTNAPATIHQTITTTGTSDEVHVWVVNQGASATTITIYMGSTGTADATAQPIAAKSGFNLVVPGLFLASGLICYGLAGATECYAYGFANRLTTGA